MNPTKTGDELGCSEKVSSSCSTSGNRRVSMVTNLMINMRKGRPDCDYHKRNIFLVSCDKIFSNC